MIQIARKLPSEAKLSIVNCDLGSFLWAKVVYDFSASVARNFDFLGRAGARKSYFRVSTLVYNFTTFFCLFMKLVNSKIL